MVYFLYYRRKFDGLYLYAYGPADYYSATSVMVLLRAWLSNNGFANWEVGLWRIDVGGELLPAR